MIEHMFDQHQVPGLQARATTSWPSPAEDYYSGPVSLDKALIKHPAATFVVRVNGDGLRSHGVLDGDELIVDRSLDPYPGHVVVVVIEGQHRVGRLQTVSHGERRLAQAFDDEADPWQSAAGPGPWGSADGWCLATDDLVLPIPTNSIFFGVASYAIHHLTGPRDLPRRRSDETAPDLSVLRPEPPSARGPAATHQDPADPGRPRAARRRPSQGSA